MIVRADDDPRLRACFEKLDALAAVKASDLQTESRLRPLAVLDTNVILDLWYWNDPQCLRLKQAVESGEVRIVASPSCFKELAAVLIRPAFQLTYDEQNAILDKVLSLAVTAHTESPSPIRCHDKEDEKFLALAFETRADFLFTKDKHVLKAGRKLKNQSTTTLRPADFDKSNA